MSQALPNQSMDVHPWWQEGKGIGTHCLSAGIAAWQVLLQPAGEAAWCAAELQSCRDGIWGTAYWVGSDWVCSTAQTFRSKWSKITLSYFCLACPQMWISYH